ncbi:hypothetical protein GCM10010308_09190 [Streptomyces vinaceusdrappus]|nr:hypothetical protein GCM10010308_09190 [Streptomyces vinaceusdrappus]
MVERGGRLGLPAEAGLEGRIAREVRAQCLHRHLASEPGVMSVVNLRHATTAEHWAQLVPAAEATRLFHGYLPALSVGPDRHACTVGGCRPAYRTRLTPGDLAKPDTRYRTGIATCANVKGT